MSEFRTHTTQSSPRLLSYCGKSVDGDDVRSQSSSHDMNIDESKEREREASSMASSTSTRSQLKQAKKERRLKLKEGEVAEAFAGNNLGTSCEDEGVQEIVVPSQLVSSEAVYDWASRMLRNSSQPIDVNPTSTSTSKRSNLRRGKRDLMSSWLATPLSGEGWTEEGGVVLHTLLPSLETSEHSSSFTRHSPPEPSTILPSQQVMYPLLQDEALTVNVESGLEVGCAHSLRGTHMKGPLHPDPAISQSNLTTDKHSPIYSELNPLTAFDHSKSHLSPPHHPCEALTDDDSGVDSSSSVRHSRPRDTIRSIQALRSSPTSTPNAEDEEETVWHRRQYQLPSLFEHFTHSNLMSNDDDVSIHHPKIHDRDDMSSSSRLSLYDVSCTLLGTTHSNSGSSSAALAGGPPLQVSGLRIQPSVKGAVYFNTDVYNLDMWDSEMFGPFAVEDSAGFVELKPEGGNIVADPTAHPTLPSLVQDPFVFPGDSFQSSVSVLAAYFDEGRRGTASAPMGDEDGSQHVLSSGRTSTSTYLPVGALRRPPTPNRAGSVFLRSYSSSVPSLSTSSSKACRGGAAHVSKYKCRTYLHQLIISHTASNVPPILKNSLNKEVKSLYVGCSAEYFDSTTTLHSNESNLENSERTSLFSYQRQPSCTLPVCVVVPPPSPLVSFHSVPAFGGDTSTSAMNGANALKIPSYSDIVRNYIVVDTLVHQATSYTEQLANPTSGAGYKKFRREHDRWQSSQKE